MGRAEATGGLVGGGGKGVKGDKGRVRGGKGREGKGREGKRGRRWCKRNRKKKKGVMKVEY